MFLENVETSISKKFGNKYKEIKKIPPESFYSEINIINNIVCSYLSMPLYFIKLGSHYMQFYSLLFKDF